MVIDLIHAGRPMAAAVVAISIEAVEATRVVLPPCVVRRAYASLVVGLSVANVLGFV
jgi:predicted MFS family arabinose efflux permease